MDLSIVIPNHNRVDALPLTLGALARQTYPADQFEVIVVDQASSDGSRELVSGFAAPYSLRLVTQDAKYGISVGRNGGVDVAQAPLVILLDADIISEPETVQAHIDLHRKSTGPILGCGRLLPYEPAYQRFIEQVANPESGLDRGTDLEDFPFWYAFGGHLSFGVSTFQQVGPFKPELKGAEDIEFAYRAEQLGIGIKNCSKAVGYHNHSRSLEERRERAFVYWRIIPTFLAMHPEVRGVIPGIAELEPIHWGHETLSSFSSKAQAEFWALRGSRAGLYRYLVWAEKNRAMPRLTKFCYYRLMLGEMRAGARRGRQLPEPEAREPNE
jgi:GT2 family glycosyltransferase